MAIIKTQMGHRIKVDQADKESLSRYCWHLMYNGYVYRVSSLKENGKWKHRSIFMHRQIMKAPKGVRVDHINGDIHDNRRKNLRLCTPQQNNINRHKLSRHNTSGLVGVGRAKRNLTKPWRAQITFNNKQIFLGWFKTKEEAKKAYNNKLKELHGKFANTKI